MSAPAFTSGAGVTLMVFWSVTARQLPLPVVVSVSVTEPLCSSKGVSVYCAAGFCASGL